MIRRTSFSPSRAALVSACAAGVLSGILACSGDDGETGPPGPPGGDGATDTDLERDEDAPGIVAEILAVEGGTRPDGTFRSGDRVSVTFELRKDDGSLWRLSEMSQARMLVSGPSFNYQRVLAEVSDVATASVDHGDGTYTYTFAEPLPATYLAPFNDSDAFDATDGELAGQSLLAGTYTVGATFRWNYTVEGESFRIAGNAEEDFLFGGATSIETREVVRQENCNQCHQDLRAHGGSRKDVQGCVLCHTVGAEDGNDPDVAGGTPGTSLDFRLLIHKIHNAKHLPSVLGVATNPDGSRNYDAEPRPYVIADPPDVEDFSHVAFPVWPNLNTPMPRDRGYSALTPAQRAQEDEIRRGVTSCAKCHGDPDDAGPIPPPAQGDVAYSQPTRQACGSCHDDVDWDLPYVANFDGGMPPQAHDSACVQCHEVSGTSLDVRDAHLHPLDDPARNPGVNFRVADGTGVGGGTGGSGSFQAGDRPTITFRLEDDAGNEMPLASLDAASAIVVGPTTNRQLVMPYPGPNPVAISPFDFAGRLASSSTSGKGTMGRALPTAASVTEVVVVDFASPTSLAVAGRTTGNLAAATLPGSPSTNPSGSSIGAIDLTAAATPQSVTVSFLGPLDFTVTGSVSGAMGSGTLPGPTSTAGRFTSTDGTLSFTVNVGSTPFAGGNAVYMAIVQGGAANPVIFPLVVGRTAFAAGDRFYYDLVAPASTYDLTIPMDLALEHLGDGDGNAGQALVAGNPPVLDGRQTLFEVTAVAPRTTLAAAAARGDRFVDVASTANFAVNDVCVLEGGAGVGTREYLQIGYVASATRLWFRTPLRYAHAAGAAADEPTLTFRQEGAANRYTLTPGTGTITSVVPFGAGNGIVMTYRSEGRFGWHRHAGDALQAIYPPPHNDSPALGADWGEWSGLPFADGTYTVSLWGSKNLNLALAGEVQQYRSASTGIELDFLYGPSATEIHPYGFISSSQNCYACHDKMLFHGGGRSGFDNCLLCHGVAGAEDWPQYNPPSTNPVPPYDGVTINFRTMLHKIHMGEELANAATYTVYGNGASANPYSHVAFPAMPNGAKNCAMCHGTENAWMEPSAREHPLQSTPAREWRAVCNSCHDSDAAVAHVDAQTAPGGEESCAICHGPGEEWSVEVMHKSR